MKAVQENINDEIITNKYAFDYLLYPFVIFKIGLLRGGIIMAFGSLIGCLISIKLYDWSKRDWLGIEKVKGWKDYSGPNRAGRFTAWVLKRSDPVARLLLTIKFDPFITTAYLRHGKYNGMTRRDWKIFFASWLIGNVWWSFACFGGVSALKWVWQKLS